MENMIAMSIKVENWEDCYQAWLDTRRSEATRKVYAFGMQDFLQVTGIQLADAGRQHIATWYRVHGRTRSEHRHRSAADIRRLFLL